MFWLRPGLPNSLAPGKRPRTTLSPSMALKGGKAKLELGPVVGKALLQTVTDESDVACCLEGFEHGVEPAGEELKVVVEQEEDLALCFEGAEIVIHASQLWRGAENLASRDIVAGFFFLALLATMSLLMFARLPSDAGAALGPDRERADDSSGPLR